MSSPVTEVSTPAPAQPPRASRIAQDAPKVVIEPRRGWIGVDWAELLRYRELLAFLIWRDVKVKYKQAILGVAWAIFVPVLSVLIYTVIGHLAGFTARVKDGVPYAVYIYAGLLPWIFLQTSISNGGMSLVTQQALMNKIYLPRLYIPTATIGGALVDMLLSGMVFIALMAYYGFVPSWQVVFLPLLILLQIVAGLGFAILLSSATVLYRDLRFIIPFITQVGIWLTAVVYPQTLFVITNAQGEVTADYRNWLALNPMAGIISGWRSAILGTPWQWPQIIGSVVLCTALLIFALAYFRRVERRFADIA